MIRIVWGTGRGETQSASFDAALAEANVHQYNLRELSSVIPADVHLEVVGEAPDLGATGNAVDVAMARQTSPPGSPAAAGIGWARDGDDGPGVFSEVDGHDPTTVRERLESGVRRGCELREIDDPAVATRVVSADPSPDRYTTAVVLAVYGESRPVL